MNETKRPLIGVGVVVIKDGKILFQKRKSAHGRGTWSFPGGHLEFGESPEECARRETMEEAGLEIKNLRLGPFTNDVHVSEDKHYITLYVISDWVEGEPRVMEPEKCECWQWCDWNDLPRPLFLPIEHLLERNFDPLSY